MQHSVSRSFSCHISRYGQRQTTQRKQKQSVYIRVCFPDMKHILDNYLISDVRLTTGCNWSRNRDGLRWHRHNACAGVAPTAPSCESRRLNWCSWIERERKSCARAAWVLCALRWLGLSYSSFPIGWRWSEAIAEKGGRQAHST